MKWAQNPCVNDFLNEEIWLKIKKKKRKKREIDAKQDQKAWETLA